MKHVIQLAVSLSLLPNLAFAQADPDLQARPLSGPAVLSPDGQYVAFVTNATDNDTIWVARSDGTNSRPFVTWRSSTQKDPDWAPDGKSLVFSSDRGGQGFNIWTVDVVPGSPPTTGNYTQLTHSNANTEYPRFSPNGAEILYLSRLSGKRELWLMTADGSSQRVIGSTSLRLSGPAWSPDGKSMVFCGCTPQGCQVYTVQADGSQMTPITSTGYQDLSPDWGPTGIIFASNRGVTPGLWLVQPDGSGLTALTEPAATGDVYPRWIRGGSSFLFSRAALGGDMAHLNVWRGGIGETAVQITVVRGFLKEGDANTDGTVDCQDVSIVRASFGKKTDQIGFDTRADMNADGVIDVRDLAYVSQRLLPGTRCQ